MLPNISQELVWLEKHPQVLSGIQRGIERETLRINSDGSLATTNHPKALGSVLTHKWITTDFAESLLEFITPVNNNINYILTVMRDIHRYTARILTNEYMWPLSMPCYIKQEQEIKLAQYGHSNIGRLKTLYREGLKNRYGALMQIISGVHYNFSLSMAFWKERFGKISRDVISNGYFSLIRNYHRFGWVIPYLFGASPAIYPSFLQNKSSIFSFEKIKYNMFYLPYATSLRLSEISYASELQNDINITFNELHEYVTRLKKAIKTPSIKYEKIGVEKEGRRIQLNSNILQIENELYALIRPKRTVYNGESLSEALLRDGIEYIEIRSLDINPFSPIGIDEQQIRFLDLFMIWCVLAESPKMSARELLSLRTNWKHIILQGRKPGLMLNIGNETTNQCSLNEIGKDLFRDLLRIAQTLDIVYGGIEYQQVCKELVEHFDNPDLTISAKILQFMIDKGIDGTGLLLATKYSNMLKYEPLMILSEADFAKEHIASIIRQHEIEKTDSESFAVFLMKRNFDKKEKFY